MADKFINCCAVDFFKKVDMYLQYELITLFKQSLPNPSIAAARTLKSITDTGSL
jgi:hypothetical protein